MSLTQLCTVWARFAIPRHDAVLWRKCGSLILCFFSKMSFLCRLHGALTAVKKSCMRSVSEGSHGLHCMEKQHCIWGHSQPRIHPYILNRFFFFQMNQPEYWRNLLSIKTSRVSKCHTFWRAHGYSRVLCVSAWAIVVNNVHIFFSSIVPINYQIWSMTFGDELGSILSFCGSPQHFVVGRTIFNGKGR